MTFPARHACIALRWTAVLALAANTGVAVARQGELPLTLADNAKLGIEIPVEVVSGVDAGMRRAELDKATAASGMHDKRLRVADLRTTSIAPAAQGRWTRLADGTRVWRVRLNASGATDLRLNFGHFALPRGARLYVIGADRYYQGPYTQADAMDGTFHAPVVPGDTATVELQVPDAVDGNAALLEVTAVGVGFRDVFGREKAQTGPGTSGACNVNVACSLGQPYADEIRAVGQYEFNDYDGTGTYICTGTLVADVPHDKKNYFLTAAHCISHASEAQSMVVYWNYQSTTCNGLNAPAGGFFNDDQHGATLRAYRADADFALVEMKTAPDPSWDLHYAGWDARNVAPSGTVGIHHPLGDAKKITAGPQPSTTYGCIAATTASNTHWLTGPYTQGTTEGGSSGSGLFAVATDANGARRRLVGVLSGGDAECSSSAPTQPNNGHDCYGKFAVAMTGSGTSSANRLREWLDPADTGASTIDGIDQNATGAPMPAGHSRHALPRDIGARVPGKRVRAATAAQDEN